ncbi:HAD-IIB family hydrolase [Aestuariirhabdus sp. LZHN29]|uniref:HAD-IIB family hydrolase n=1 Tax=Aestuariirhabdus sp. LZHN29 TaxID=3417462 RepID=UPI003CF1615E
MDICGQQATLIFTDLDGCLIDHDGYSYAASAQTLAELKTRVAIIINSSKTFSEIEQWQREFGLDTPFIFENGSAIAFPQQWSPSLPASAYPYHNRLIIPLAGSRELLLHRLSALATDYRFKGFYSMAPEEVVALTGLSEAAAQQAQDRLFTEPLHWQDTEVKLARFAQALDASGLCVQRGGRFVHVMDRVDKAIAMRTLQIMLEQRDNTSYQTLALGDSDNDRRMLESADISCVVRKPSGEHLKLKRKQRVLYSEQVGSSGWNECVAGLMDRGFIYNGDN